MNITLIGTGNIGSAIAKRLLGSGYALTVFNRTKEKALPLVSLGAVLADSIEEAVAEADVVFTSLFNDAALTDVSESILKHKPTDFIHVSTSTILPKTASVLSKRYFEAGAAYIAAPVLGIPKTLKNQEAMTFCSGPKEAIDQVFPLLQTYSKNIQNLGEEASHANVLKICMNYSIISAIELISELYAFAEKSGVDKAIVRNNLKQIYAHPAFHVYIDKIYDRQFDEVNFDVKGGDKDVRLFQQAFLDVNVLPDIADIVLSKFTQALAEGIENKDWSVIGDIVRSRSGM